MTDKVKRNLRIIFLLFALIVFIAGSILFSAKRIHFEESISSILPADKNNELLVEVLDSAKFFDRIVFHIYLRDTAATDPNKLVSAANALTDSIRKNFIPDFVLKIEGKNDASLQTELIDNFYKYLPLYLESADYIRLDSLIQHGNFDGMMQEFIKVLNSPAGFMAAPYFFRDPLGLAAGQLHKLKDLQLDDNLTLYQNYLVTKNKKHLLFFVTPTDAKNTGKNKKFVDHLNKIISEITSYNNQNISIDYIGSLPVATANAQQIKKDVQLTVSIALIIIVILIYYFFRKKYILGLILLPAIFGATVALIYLSFSHQNLSLISLGIGSVILGITVDYALHLLTHLKHQKDVWKSLKKVSLPIIISSITTATAFLCLMLLSSPALKQLGIFASISVLAAAILTVAFLPLLLTKKSKEVKLEKANLIEKIAGYQAKKKGLIFLLLLVITVVLFFFSKKVQFEKDIEKSNYMPRYLSESLNRLNDISEVYHKKVYLLSRGQDLDSALAELEQNTPRLKELKQSGRIEDYHGIYSLVFSTSRQKARINSWNSFWTEERKLLLKSKLNQAATRNSIKKEAFDNFYALIDRSFEPVPPSALFSDFSSLIGDFNIQISNGVVVPTIISIDNSSQKNELMQAFEGEKNSVILDRKDFFNKIFDVIERDFSKLIKISLVLVFLIILLFLGRIEIAVITFIPILISWFWTLGIMGITGLKLNYFNIIICTLIFGLGVDYSIFITKGLIHKFKYGSDELRSFKSSILISSLTTLAGLGVLILAKHPALRSIASLSIIGIVSVLLVSFTLQPILFHSLIERKGAKRSFPITILNCLFSIIIFMEFTLASLVLSIFIPLIAFLPLKKSRKQFLIRLAMHGVLKTIVNMHPNVRIRKQGLDKDSFKIPSILVSNHQSMIDILLFLGLSPNIIMITKDWVWNSPVFGFLVRYCGFIHISKGYENVLDDIQKQIDNGCSVLVFPEGSRSKNGKIGRFHKGGFYIAQKLGLPVQPMIVHGAWDVLPRDSFLINPGEITVSKLTAFKIDANNNRAYSHVAKQTCDLMRKAFKELREECYVPKYFRYRIVANHIYKGPILENYIKIKLRLEDYYKIFHSLIPKSGVVTDIGCGYGLMAYMLSLCAPDRKINAIDYDENKISAAKNSELSTHCNIRFETADAVNYNLKPSDVFIISDMLHYLSPKDQMHLLNQCILKLKEKGKLIIRDSDLSLKTRHFGTQLSEFMSTHIGFNKTRNKLHFISREFIETVASTNNLDIRIIDRTKYTSNLIYILQRKNNEN